MSCVESQSGKMLEKTGTIKIKTMQASLEVLNASNCLITLCALSQNNNQRKGKLSSTDFWTIPAELGMLHWGRFSKNTHFTHTYTHTRAQCTLSTRRSHTKKASSTISRATPEVLAQDICISIGGWKMKSMQCDLCCYFFLLFNCCL